MEARGWSLDDVVTRLGERGRKTTDAYLRHLLAFRKRPSFGFADDLAALFDRELSAETILRLATTEDGRSVANAAGDDEAA